MSSFVTSREWPVAGKITRSGLDTRTSRPSASTKVTADLDIVLAKALAGLELAPAACAVVGDDLREHCGQGPGVDLLFAPEGDCPGRLVAVSPGDDSLRIGHDAAVVQEQIDVIFRRKPRSYVAVQHVVRLNGALDRLDYF